MLEAERRGQRRQAAGSQRRRMEQELHHSTLNRTKLATSSTTQSERQRREPAFDKRAERPHRNARGARATMKKRNPLPAAEARTKVAMSVPAKPLAMVKTLLGNRRKGR